MGDIVERLRFLGSGEPFRGALMCEAADEIERLRDAIKRQAAAAITGMDAATRISSAQLEQARVMRAESSPAAIDSERDANAVLTGEVERLRAELERWEQVWANVQLDVPNLRADNKPLAVAATYALLRQELAEAKRYAERYRLELQFIANADPKQWDAEVRDQFQQWAQSRAREAIDATLAEEARTRK